MNFEEMKKQYLIEKKEKKKALFIDVDKEDNTKEETTPATDAEGKPKQQDAVKTPPAQENLEPEITPEEKLKKDIEAKFEAISKNVIEEMKKFLDKNPEIIFKKVADFGMPATLEDFLDNYYIKLILTDPSEKMFLIINKYGFMEFTLNKLATEFIPAVKKKEEDKAKKD